MILARYTTITADLGTGYLIVCPRIPVLREAPQAQPTEPVYKLEPSDIRAATGCAMDYRESLDLDQPMEIESAVRVVS